MEEEKSNADFYHIDNNLNVNKINVEDYLFSGFEHIHIIIKNKIRII